MLSAIDVAGTLSLPLLDPAFPQCTHLVKLLSLQLVQQDLAKALVEILSKAMDGLLQDIVLGGSDATLLQLVGGVHFQDLVDWMRHGKGDEGLVLGHLLPVIDEDGLEIVGHGDLDREFVGEGVFLFGGRWFSKLGLTLLGLTTLNWCSLGNCIVLCGFPGLSVNKPRICNVPIRLFGFRVSGLSWFGLALGCHRL